MDTIKVTQAPTYTNLHINRPSTLNSLSNDMINNFRSNISLNSKLIFTGEGRSFCAGGDIVALVNGQTRPSDFFSNEFRLFFEISCLPTETIAILDGITMGGGAGLAMACGCRVLTNKTLWAMPETAIGFFPDVGASFFLNRLVSEPLGLYLGLTGARLTGADAYFAGISEYYVENFTEIHKRMIFEEGVEGVRRAGGVPDSLKSGILRDLPVINQCFDVNLGVEAIMERLAGVGQEWSRKTLAVINEMCPVSLRITKELNRLGKRLSYLEALQLEYDICVKVTEIDNCNFVNSITQKLINKVKGPVVWSPSSVAEVSDGYIASLFSKIEHKLFNPNL